MTDITITEIQVPEELPKVRDILKSKQNWTLEEAADAITDLSLSKEESWVLNVEFKRNIHMIGVNWEYEVPEKRRADRLRTAITEEVCLDFCDNDEERDVIRKIAAKIDAEFQSCDAKAHEAINAISRLNHMKSRELEALISQRRAFSLLT